MHAAVTKSKNETLPWGIEVELVSDRCVYMSARKIITHEGHIDIIVNDDNVISIPKESIRKMLILGSNAGTDTTD